MLIGNLNERIRNRVKKTNGVVGKFEKKLEITMTTG